MLQWSSQSLRFSLVVMLWWGQELTATHLCKSQQTKLFRHFARKLKMQLRRLHFPWISAEVKLIELD